MNLFQSIDVATSSNISHSKQILDIKITYLKYYILYYIFMLIRYTKLDKPNPKSKNPNPINILLGL